MGHLSIRCNGCGSDWVVYHREDFHDFKCRTCPVCGKMISLETWKRQVLRGFGEMEDANRELFRDHVENHGTLFTVSYIPDVSFPNSSGSMETEVLREEIEDLKDGIDNLRTIVKKLVEGVFEIE